MPDLWLVFRCRQGDPEAFAALYQRYAGQAYRTALHLVREPHLAEDITQEAFVTVFQEIGRLRSPAAFRTWLYRIVVSRATRFLRAEGGARRALSLDVIPELAEGMLADPDELAALRDAIADLADELRIPLLLHYYSGLTVAEVAKVVQIPDGTVKSRLFTARRRLAEALSAAPADRRADRKELSV